MAEARPRPKKRRSEEYKARRREVEKERTKTRIYIGESIQRWRELRRQKGFQSDAQVAKFLLDSSQVEMNSRWLQDFAPYSPSSELDSSSAREESPVSSYSWMKQEPETEIIQWENINSLPAANCTAQDNTLSSAVSTVIPSITEDSPSSVALTITKLNCLLESKQERIEALERQVQDLQEDRRFLRSQIQNLTSALSTHVCRGVSDETTGKKQTAVVLLQTAG